jgi:hypothetical protein
MAIEPKPRDFPEAFPEAFIVAFLILLFAPILGISQKKRQQQQEGWRALRATFPHPVTLSKLKQRGGCKLLFA